MTLVFCWIPNLLTSNQSPEKRLCLRKAKKLPDSLLGVCEILVCLEVGDLLLPTEPEGCLDSGHNNCFISTVRRGRGPVGIALLLLVHGATRRKAMGAALRCSLLLFHFIERSRTFFLVLNVVFLWTMSSMWLHVPLSASVQVRVVFFVCVWALSCSLVLVAVFRRRLAQLWPDARDRSYLWRIRLQGWFLDLWQDSTLVQLVQSCFNRVARLSGVF